MKTVLSAFLLVCCALAGRAQATLATVELPHEAALTMRRVPFKNTGQKMVYSGISGLSLNGQPVYGTDGEPPRYKLVSAMLLLQGTCYSCR